MTPKQTRNEMIQIVKEGLQKEFDSQINFLYKNAEECAKDRKEYFATTWKRYDQKTKDLLYYFVYNNNDSERGQKETIAKIKKTFDKKVDNIVSKIEEKTDGITSFDKIHEDGMLTVYIFNSKGQTRYLKFERIMAGGYGTQKFHIRFVIQVTKNPPSNMR